jgi:soluble lytic murein transglycosylase-like protein
MITQGNIDLSNRPIVKNASGPPSTEYSVSMQDDKGREVLIPTIVNGKFLTPDGKKPPVGSDAEKQMFKNAWQHYKNTGENMGIFKDAKSADDYANTVEQWHFKNAAKPVPDAVLKKIADRAAAKENVDPKLIHAMIEVESKGKNKSTSQKGAGGPMQLMPHTARSLGVKNLYDPIENIHAGTKYIAKLLKKYNGDLKLALAAYNAGEGNVHKYKGIPPFKETRNYVAKITNLLAEKG